MDIFQTKLYNLKIGMSSTTLTRQRRATEAVHGAHFNVNAN